MIRPPDASAAPVYRPADPAAGAERGAAAGPSAPADPDDSHRAVAPPILAAREIFDARGIARDIRADMAAGACEADIRAAAVARLKPALAAGRERIADAFAAHPRAARPAVAAYTMLTDGIVRTVFDLASRDIHPGGPPEDLALFAVGGYGRGDMAPFSDCDLLFLSKGSMGPETEAIIESMLYILWDLKLKVGHASRTIRECVRLGREDFTIRTSLLETRFLTGNLDLDPVLQTALRNQLFAGTGPDFITAKLEERGLRHEKQGGQRYVVEPNVKEGKGGLRDLQTLFWIAKYVHGVPDVADLVPRGVFADSEFKGFVEAETFLLAVRCHLHLIAGRAMDQLTFDLQVEVAARMGYADRGGRRGVEHFMQAYFRHATRVGELTRILLAALEADHIKAAPDLVRLFRRRRRVRPGWQVVQNRLSFADEAAFLSDKLNLLRIFDEALRTGLLLHPDAMRAIAGNLHLIDDGLRRDPAAIRIFWDLLLKHGNPGRALRRMNELGVLGAFLPDFEVIVAMMQFNMYHHFTVDEHTIQCVIHLSEIEDGARADDRPIATEIVRAGLPRRVMYLALLLHDIGKGRDEDHSVLGARIARRVAPELGLGRGDAEIVEWLVRHHLMMSDTAQKRDLADPRTIRGFARAVGSRKRLDLLYVLTVCDITGVGPGTWNNWKGQLLASLYRQTLFALENGLAAVSRETKATEARAALRAALPDWSARDLRAETQRHYAPYWQGLGRESHVAFARLLRDIEDDEVRIDLMPDEARDATRICFAMADHPGIFSRLTGALAMVGANVVDARSYISKDGYVTAVFWVQDSEEQPYDAARLPRLRRTIERTLAGEVIAVEKLESRDKMRKRERGFRVPTIIAFDNEGSDIYTIIEVDTRDRPGLLHDLTRVFAEANIQTVSAVIATYGEQVVDTFYVKDVFGLKIHAEARQRALERKLRDAIESGAARARR